MSLCITQHGHSRNYNSIGGNTQIECDPGVDAGSLIVQRLQYPTQFIWIIQIAQRQRLDIIGDYVQVFRQFLAIYLVFGNVGVILEHDHILTAVPVFSQKLRKGKASGFKSKRTEKKVFRTVGKALHGG